MSNYNVYHAPNSISAAWASPQTPLGSLQRSPDHKGDKNAYKV